MSTGLGSGITAVAAAIWFLSNLVCYAVNQNSWLSRFLGLPPLLCVSNGLRFAEPQPEKYWLFDVLDPTDLAKSWWIGTPGLLLLRLLIVVYLANILARNRLPASESRTTPWTADFANWSFYLVLASAVLGLVVSLKYLAIRHWISKTIVHGRPGQISQYGELSSTAESSFSGQVASAQDIELGITSELIQPALPAAVNKHASALCDSPEIGPQEAAVSTESSQHAAGSSTSFHAQGPAAPTFTVAKSTQLNFKLPPELLYDSQLSHWSILENLHCLVLQTAAVTSTAVLVFYWATSAGHDAQDLRSDSYLHHAAFVPFTVLDTCLSKAPFASYHLQVMILFGTAYELCMWLYYGDSQQWVYTALDWQANKSVLVYVFLPVVYTALFFVWFALTLLRNYIGLRCGSHKFCQQCYNERVPDASLQSQSQDLPAGVTGRLKKQSSNIIFMYPESSSNTFSSFDIIAPDTRYAGQQILTMGRRGNPQSPDTPSLMELSRRGSAPRQS